MKDSYGLLLSNLEAMEEDLLRKLRTCSTEELIEVQAEARVIHRMREKILATKTKQEKEAPRAMPAGL